MSISAPQPIREELVDSDRFITRSWRNYLFAVQTVTETSAQVLPAVTLNAQHAAIASTPVPTSALTAGYYRVSVYAVITTAATTSSSLTLSVRWTDAGGLLCQQLLPALTTNVVGAVSTLTFPIHIDSTSPISYAVAYASNVAGQMTYNFGILVESL